MIKAFFLMFVIMANINTGEVYGELAKEEDVKTTEVLALYGEDNMFISSFPITQGSDKLSTDSVRFFERSASAPIFRYKDLSTTSALKVFNENIPTTESVKDDVYASIIPLYERHKEYRARPLEGKIKGIIFWHKSRQYVLGFYCPDTVNGHLIRLKIPKMQMIITQNIFKYIDKYHCKMKRWNFGDKWTGD